VKQLKNALEARQADIKTKSAAAQQSEEQVKRLEQMLRESQVATDRVQKEFNLLNEKVQKLHHDLEDQIHTNTQLLAENSQKAVELKQKEEDIVAVKVSWASPPCPSLLLWPVGFHNYVHHCGSQGQLGFTTMSITVTVVSWVSQLCPSLLLWSVGFHNYVHHCYCGQLGFTTMSIIVAVVSWVSQLCPSLLLWSVGFHNYVHHCCCGHNWVGD